MSGERDPFLHFDPIPESGMVSVVLAFPGPEQLECEGEYGLTGLFLKVLRAGAGIVPEEEVARTFDGWGGGLHSFCGDGACGLSYTCLPEALPESLQWLARLMQGDMNPPIALVEREKAARIALIQEERDDPSWDGLRQMRKRLLGAGALGLSPLGSEEDLRGISLEKLLSLGQRLRGQSRRCLGISGDFEPDSIGARARALLPEGEAVGAELHSGETVDANSFRETVRHPREQSVVVHALGTGGFRDSRADERLLALSCLNGLSGPLFEEIRERHGLAYYSSARLVAGMNRGMIAFVSGCEERQAHFLQDRLEEILQRITVRGFSADEFSAGVAQCRSGLLLSRQRSSWRAQRLAVRGVQGLNTDLGEASEAFYDTITRDQLRDWWSGIFATRSGSTLFLLPHKN
ncbi:MAG: M16 family metallopeptidase [Puniceicoccales bacterium]